jgi:hypothetical protein
MRRALVVMLVALINLGVAERAVAADPTAEAEAVLAWGKTVTGGPAWDALQGWHEQGVIHRRDAEAVEYEIWIDVNHPAMLSLATVGGHTRADGFNGVETWRVDASGARIGQDAKSLSDGWRSEYFGLYGFYFPERFAAERTYVGARVVKGAIFDIVRVTPRGGTPMDLWFDRKSHMLSALVDPDPAHPMVVTPADFRQTHGVLLPYAIIQKTSGAAVIRTVSGYDFSPVAASRFAPPGQ